MTVLGEVICKLESPTARRVKDLTILYKEFGKKLSKVWDVLFSQRDRLSVTISI